MKRLILLAALLTVGCGEDRVTTPTTLLTLGGYQPQSPEPSGPWTSGAPELPRVLLDTRMPVQKMSGDTLYFVAGQIQCKGPEVTRDSRCPQYVAGSPPLSGGSTILVGDPEGAAVSRLP